MLHWPWCVLSRNQIGVPGQWCGRLTMPSPWVLVGHPPIYLGLRENLYGYGDFAIFTKLITGVPAHRKYPGYSAGLNPNLCDWKIICCLNKGKGDKKQFRWDCVWKSSCNFCWMFGLARWVLLPDQGSKCPARPADWLFPKHRASIMVNCKTDCS